MTITTDGRRLIYPRPFYQPDFILTCRNEIEAQQRARVLTEVLEWKGTPYHHFGKIKGLQGGVDCATLFSEVYWRAEIIPHDPLPPYPPDWASHREDERYMSVVMKYARGIEESEALPADIVLFKYGRAFSHGAMIMPPGYPEIIHAHKPTGRVTLDIPDSRMAGLPRKFFTFWS